MAGFWEQFCLNRTQNQVISAAVHWRMLVGNSGDFVSLAASAACFGKASRTATIIGVYINGSSEKVEKLE
jgi:hypothetical protein